MAKGSVEEVPTEVLAQTIEDISEGMKELRSGRLNNRALVILLSEASGVNRRECNKVLDGLESLGDLYLKKLKDQKAERRHKKKREEEDDDETF